MTAVLIEDIRIDGGTQSRVEIDNELVAEYAELMREGVKFPQIEVMHDGTTYWLVNGFHRWHAARRVGLPAVECEVYSGSLRDAQLASFGANADHGKRRTNADKRKAVETMLADSEWTAWSDTQIAKICFVTQPFVSRVRSESHHKTVLRCDEKSVRTVTRNGKTYTQDVSKIGKKKAEAVEQIQQAVATGKVKQEPKLSWQKVEPKDDSSAPEDFDPEKDMLPEGEAEALMAELEEAKDQFLIMLQGDDPLAVALQETEELRKQLLKARSDLEFWKRNCEGYQAQLSVCKNELGRIKRALHKKGEL